MQYLVDGHNLIPKVGLRLDAFDDELQLMPFLQEFARLTRSKIEVYFDGAPIGQSGTRKYGTIKAHFVRAGQTADAAIRARLHKMGKASKNWVVVSSDREVQGAARAHGAQVMSSDEFAKKMRAAKNSAPKPNVMDDKKLSPGEVEKWIQIFRDKDH